MRFMGIFKLLGICCEFISVCLHVYILLSKEYICTYHGKSYIYVCVFNKIKAFV